MTKKSWDLGGNRNRLYGRRWRNARGLYLASNPLCVMCKLEDKTRAATVVGHVVPHRGNEELFWDMGVNIAAAMFYKTYAISSHVYGLI